MGEYELTAADLAEITYPVVFTIEHGRQYQATFGRHVVGIAVDMAAYLPAAGAATS